MAGLVAIVPLRALDGAKSRLGGVLDAEERQDLVTDLLRRTIAAAGDAPAVDEVVVVSPDPAVLAVARAGGAVGLEQHGSGLNGALEEARDQAIERGAYAILVVPADLPAISAAAIASFIEATLPDRPPVVGLVTDRHERGTNALLLAPPDVIAFAFGGDSRVAHAARARAAGARYVEVGGVLALDIDTPDDLLHVESADPAALRR
jgi:2-phospho-L-lactate guanylyltransferase